MGDRTTLTALQERLEKATGPDRALDLAVQRWLYESGDGVLMPHNWSAGDWITLGEDGEFVEVWRGNGPMSTGDRYLPRYTADLNAVIALVERKLPGWRIENIAEWDNEVLRARGPWMAQLRRRGTAELFEADSYHSPTPALALLKAFVAVLIAQDPNP